MSNKKHIDRLFQEKFKDFEVKPSPAVWEGIQSQIDQKKEERKAFIPIWFKYAGLAAALLLFVALGTSLFNEDKIDSDPTTIVDIKKASSTKSEISNSNNKISNESTNTENKSDRLIRNLKEGVISKNEGFAESPSTKTKPASQSDKASNAINSKKKDIHKETKDYTQQSYASTNASINNQEKSTTVTNINQYTEDTNKNSDFKNKTIKDSNTENTAVAVQQTTKVDLETNKAQEAIDAMKKSSSEKDLAQTTEDTKIEKDTTKTSESIEEAIVENESKIEEEKLKSKWTVNANIGPVYYNSFGKGSPVHEQFTDNKKNGELNTSYGVMVGYALNDRVKVRSGINKLNLSYDTANVLVYETVSSNQGPKGLRNINFVTNSYGQSISVLSSNNLVMQQISNESNVVNKENASLSQRMSYFEVPLELEYALIKKRFGINLIGGFSTFILNNNKVVSEFEGRKTLIGTANNINNLSFSTNLGVGLDYKFSKTFKLNIEPSFKYQINTFSEVSGNFKPYIIGVYTGFSYKF